MPTYFFALNNDPPAEQATENLPSDAAARALAIQIAMEICRNPKSKPVPVAAYDARGRRLGEALIGEDGTTIFRPPVKADV